VPFVITSAGRVFYEHRGSGPPVVLLHATLHDHTDFDPVARELAGRYTTIAVDWPGHGQSDPISEGRVADAFLFAEVLADLADLLDLAPAVLIGNSVGGFAAARLALDEPDRVAGLVLVNGAGFTRQTAASRLACRVLGNPRAKLVTALALAAGLAVRVLSIAGAGAALAVSCFYLARMTEPGRRDRAGLAGFAIFGALACALLVLRIVA